MESEDQAFVNRLRSKFSGTEAARMLRQYVNAAVIAERERNAGIAYRTCAETRHVTLGDKCAQAIREQSNGA